MSFDFSFLCIVVTMYVHERYIASYKLFFFSVFLAVQGFECHMGYNIAFFRVLSSGLGSSSIFFFFCTESYHPVNMYNVRFLFFLFSCQQKKKNIIS